MSEATQTQTLEETLNKTDLGHLLYEHRKSIFYVILFILLSVVGWVFWNQTSVNSSLKNSELVFEFQNKTWADFKVGKTTPVDLVKSFKQLEGEVKLAPVMMPLVLEMSKALYDKEAFTEAEQLVGELDGKLTHPVGAFFVGLQRAVVLEKLGKTKEATVTLENLLKNKDMVMKPKLAVELGRLHMVLGEKGKAQTQFDYVIANFPNDELAKLAKLYLAQLAP